MIITVNQIEYEIDELANGKWVWSNDDESIQFDTACEAMQDAMRDCREREREREERDEVENTLYRMSDVEWDFKTSRL